MKNFLKRGLAANASARKLLNWVLICEIVNRMFVRLAKANRSKAGRLLVLVYLVCLLAPSISVAFAETLWAAPYLAGETHGLGVVHVHELSSDPTQHARNHSRKHNHSIIYAIFGKSGDKDRDSIYVADETPAPTSGPDKASGAQCCGMMCLSALPSSAIDIVRPIAPTSICVTEKYRGVIDNAPLRLYRPPIIA